MARDIYIPQYLCYDGFLSRASIREGVRWTERPHVTRLARENLSDVLPPAWIESTLFTHPANARRILMAEKAR